MRPISDELKARFESQLQTAANNADPKLPAILAHETVPLTSSDFLERELITEATGLTACSVAIRRPVAGQKPDRVYVAYIDENGAHVKKSDLPSKLSALAWTDVTPAAIETADDIAVAFDGSGDRVTGSEPWVLWTDGGVLYAMLLDSANAPITLEASGCTKVSAIRGMSDSPSGTSYAFTVFYIKSGALFCRTFTGTTWSAADQVTLGPAGVTWTDVAAFRTHDTRIGVQAKTSNGQVYELFSLPTPPASAVLFISEDSSDFSISVQDNIKHWDGTMYYSTDAITWAEWNGTSAVNSSGGKVYLRGSGNTYMVMVGSVPHYQWHLTDGKRIRCIGNIENLLDWQTVATGQHPEMSASCFYGMFYGCSSLVSAPDLPATTITDACYREMFCGCTSLIAAPELPATTLGGSNCYREMFSGCTSLITAPKLPATTLTGSCYYEMFYNCTSLIAAQELPATTLKGDCYRSMFNGCTALKISASQDSTYQYPYRIPQSGTGVDATNARYRMFAGTGGTFTDTPDINTTYYTDHAPVS